MFFCSLHEMTRLKQKQRSEKIPNEKYNFCGKKTNCREKKMGKKCTKDEIGWDCMHAGRCRRREEQTITNQQLRARTKTTTKNCYQIWLYYSLMLREERLKRRDALEIPTIYELWWKQEACVTPENLFCLVVFLLANFLMLFNIDAGYTWVSPCTNINIHKFVTL